MKCRGIQRRPIEDRWVKVESERVRGKPRQIIPMTEEDEEVQELPPLSEGQHIGFAVEPK